MIATAFSTTDVTVGAVIVLVVIVLVYRLLRREPNDRVVRFGVFIERQRMSGAGDEKVTERHEWPRQKEEDL